MNRYLQIGLLSGMLGIAGVISVNAQTENAPNAITVKINNSPVHFDSAPVMRQGIILAPLRGFLEAMGAEVSFQPDTHNIKMLIHGNTVEMKTGARYIYVNGSERALPRPLPVINGHTMIPLRAVAEKMGATVKWNSAQRTVLIDNLRTETPQPSSGQGIRAGEIEVRVKADKSTFHAGETVHFTVTAMNTDDRPRTVTLPSGQNFDIIITPKDKTAPQWQWSHGKMFTMMVRYVKLQPGQRLTFTTDWDQKDNEGKLMPRGEMQVNAKLAAANSGIKAPVIAVNLVE